MGQDHTGPCYSSQFHVQCGLCIFRNTCVKQIRFPRLYSMGLLPISSSCPCFKEAGFPQANFSKLSLPSCLLSLILSLSLPLFLPSSLLPSQSLPPTLPSFFFFLCFLKCYCIAMSPNNSTPYVYNDFPVYNLFSQVPYHLILTG